MPKPRSTIAKRQLPPFSLVLKPDEMKALATIAQKEGTSMGAVVRRAITTVIASKFPEYRTRIIESEAEAFLDHLAREYPSSLMTASQRKEFRRLVVKLLG